VIYHCCGVGTHTHIVQCTIACTALVLVHCTIAMSLDSVVMATELAVSVRPVGGKVFTLAGGLNAQIYFYATLNLHSIIVHKVAEVHIVSALDIGIGRAQHLESLAALSRRFVGTGPRCTVSSSG
jgi:hypothetical protein